MTHILWLPKLCELWVHTKPLKQSVLAQVFAILSDLDAFSEQDDNIASRCTMSSTGIDTASDCMLTQHGPVHMIKETHSGVLNHENLGQHLSSHAEPKWSLKDMPCSRVLRVHVQQKQGAQICVTCHPHATPLLMSSLERKA